jgi:type II secretory pathway component PulF
MTGWLVEVGKSPLNSPQTLEEAAKQYKREEENRLTALATMFEPLLMFSVGIMIALLVIALSSRSLK